MNDLTRYWLNWIARPYLQWALGLLCWLAGVAGGLAGFWLYPVWQQTVQMQASLSEQQQILHALQEQLARQPARDELQQRMVQVQQHFPARIADARPLGWRLTLPLQRSDSRMLSWRQVVPEKEGATAHWQLVISGDYQALVRFLQQLQEAGIIGISQLQVRPDEGALRMELLLVEAHFE